MADRNKRSSASFVPFKPLDNLFEPTVQEKPAPAENGLTNLFVDNLHSFKDHPFRVKDDDKMQETAESIKEYGVLVPALARPREDGGYELIAGHRRKRGCAQEREGQTQLYHQPLLLLL